MARSSINVNPGDNITYAWSSTGGASYSWSATDENGNPIATCTDCNTASGSSSFSATSDMQGHTYTITYTVTNAANQKVSSSVTIIGNPPPGSNSATLGISNVNFSVSSPWTLSLSSTEKGKGLNFWPTKSMRQARTRDGRGLMWRGRPEPTAVGPCPELQGHGEMPRSEHGMSMLFSPMGRSQTLFNFSLIQERRFPAV